MEDQSEIVELYTELRSRIFLLENIVSLMAVAIESGEADGIKHYLELLRAHFREGDYDHQLIRETIIAIDSFPIPAIKASRVEGN